MSNGLTSALNFSTPTAEQSPVNLEIRDLCKSYPGGIQAVQSVSLSLSSGMFGLLGPNGAGKTTLMEIVATLRQPDSGTVSFGDIDVLANPQGLREQLGYLPQEYGFYQNTSAERMLDYLAQLKGIAVSKQRKAHVSELLERVNLAKDKHRDLDTFSGGMKQRFGVAQALLGNPRLVIVDEPTAGLDPAERRRLHEILSDISDHALIILSTHIVDDVASLCDQMAIIHKGRLIRQGNPLELMGSLRGKLWKLTVPRQELADYRQRYEVISTQLHAGQVILSVYQEAPPGDPFLPKAPDLDDVYFLNLQQIEV